MSVVFQDYETEPQKPKHRFELFFDKWMIVIACYALSLSFFTIDLKFANRHYPELSELTQFSGGLEQFSVIDKFKNHKITMKLMTGDTFYFDKVDFFPPVKNALANGSQIDLWVDGTKDHDIWQISINDKIVMSRDALVGALKKRNSNPYRTSIYLFLAGTLFTIMLTSKNKLISEKVYPITVAIVGIAFVIINFCLVFLGKK